MATWKKVVVSGSAISQLNNDSNYLVNGTSSASLTGSFTGSFAGDGSGLTNVPISGTASSAVSASHANNADNAISASYAQFAGTANLASEATSASRATSAADADNAVSASFASTASYVNALSQSVLISGSLSLALTGSSTLDIVGNGFSQTSLISAGGLVLTPGYGGVEINGTSSSLKINDYLIVGSYISASGAVTASAFLGNGAGITGVITSSYAFSASNAVFSISASRAVSAADADNAANAVSASVAGYADSAGTASYATNAGNATTATSASHAVNADSAVSSSYALSASFSTFASSATNAATASQANTANSATSASYALTASYAENANADLAFSGSTGVGTVDLASQVLSIIGTANEIETSAGGTTLTIGLPQDVTIGQNLTVNNNLTVLGTASFQSTQNLEVADRFILMASGSNTTGDGGIVVQQDTQGVGELFAWDAGDLRWAVTGSFDASQSSFTPEAFMAAVIEGAASDPTAVVAKLTKKGNIFVAADETIWIYS